MDISGLIGEQETKKATLTKMVTGFNNQIVTIQTQIKVLESAIADCDETLATLNEANTLKAQKSAA